MSLTGIVKWARPVYFIASSPEFGVHVRRLYPAVQKREAPIRLEPAEHAGEMTVRDARQAGRERDARHAGLRKARNIEVGARHDIDRPLDLGSQRADHLD